MAEPDEGTTPEPADPSYEPPRIRTLGKIADLTRTVGPSQMDATDG